MSEFNAFLELLRSALWQRPIDQSLFPATTDWKRMLAIANHQAVAGIISEGVPLLPEACRPSEELFSEMHRMSVANVRMHARMNAVLTEVTTLLRKAEIPSLLLKGQGLASLYPIPHSRQCGDIDLYVSKDYQDELLSLVRQWKKASHLVNSEKHLSFDYDGVCVELHYGTEHFYTPKVDKAYQRWSLNNLEYVLLIFMHPRGFQQPLTAKEVEDRYCRYIEVNGEIILIPCVEFDAIYLLHHLWNHFISSGIGLRQICDWCLFMRRYSSQLETKKMRTLLTTFAFFPVWNLFASFAVRYMGMEWKDFPFAEPVEDAKVEKLMEIIWQEGNFGRRKPRPKGYIVGKVNMYWRVTKMIKAIYPFYPREVVGYYFYFMALGVKHFFLDWRHMK
ncbi:MAG: nucleotidyltransferase family protein [Paludibacteraceae bacterium]|nr:nucleotidyltransferase family protein [Paludibacteraceae bacterium]